MPEQERLKIKTEEKMFFYVLQMFGKEIGGDSVFVGDTVPAVCISVERVYILPFS